MKRIIMANDENIDDIVTLRVKMQVEDWNFTLTTNAPDAAHIYEKAGFQKISDKYFLGS